MSKRSVLISVLVLGAGQAAWGQYQGEEVRSYYSTSALVIPAVPVGGFVITDVHVYATGTYNIQENAGGPVIFRSSFGPGEYHVHFKSGLRVSEGSEIYQQSGAIGAVTLSGYIPGTGVRRGDIPAISSIGMGIMLLFIVAVGGFVFKRVKMAG